MAQIIVLHEKRIERLREKEDEHRRWKSRRTGLFTILLSVPVLWALIIWGLSWLF